MMTSGIILITLQILIPVYVCEVIETSFSITTYDSYSNDLNGNPNIYKIYTNLANHGINTTTQWDLVFEVQSCSDAFILLTERSDLTGPALFEIVIGGWANTRICINTGSSQTSPLTGTIILDCNSYKFFWLKWTVNGDVSFGMGETVDVNSVFTKSTGKVIGGLGVRSGFSRTAYWRYNKTVCSDGTYGEICDKNCGHCVNIICERADGACPTGCQPDWIGTMCFEAITTTVTTELTTFKTTQSTTDTISTSDAITTRAITTKDTISTSDAITLTNDVSTNVQHGESTPVTSTTSGMTGCCPCSHPTVPNPGTNQNTDTESVVDKVDKLSLSSYRRKYTSASDPRKSSMYIGAFGVAIISSTILFIVALDFLPGLRK